MPKHLESTHACACTSGRSFGECCRPYLRGEAEAPTAEKLMRSRFSAFALGYVEYLWKTLASTHPDKARPEEEVLRELRRTCKHFEFRRLEVLAAKEDEVVFRATMFERTTDRSFTERSKFVHESGAWRYAAVMQG